jgi:hypothetical protein
MIKKLLQVAQALVRAHDGKNYSENSIRKAVATLIFSALRWKYELSATQGLKFLIRHQKVLQKFSRGKLL